MLTHLSYMEHLEKLVIFLIHIFGVSDVQSNTHRCWWWTQDAFNRFVCVKLLNFSCLITSFAGHIGLWVVAVSISILYFGAYSFQTRYRSPTRNAQVTSLAYPEISPEPKWTSMDPLWLCPFYAKRQNLAAFKVIWYVFFRFFFPTKQTSTIWGIYRQYFELVLGFLKQIQDRCWKRTVDL